jgi:hypothetical protein
MHACRLARAHTLTRTCRRFRCARTRTSRCARRRVTFPHTHAHAHTYAASRTRERTRAHNREVVKAVLGFLRVAIGGADRAVLAPLLPAIVGGVMTGVPRATRLYLRARTKVVLAKLCRKFGFERVKVRR